MRGLWVFKRLHMTVTTMTLMAGLALTSLMVVAQTIEIDGEIFRDPTQPPGAVYQESVVVSFEQEVPRISLSNFTLSFVRSGGINPVAVINNRTVTEGDEVGGAMVARIQAGAVVLLIEGQEQVLNLYRQPVRQSLTDVSLEN